MASSYFSPYFFGDTYFVLLSKISSVSAVVGTAASCGFCAVSSGSGTVTISTVSVQVGGGRYRWRQPRLPWFEPLRPFEPVPVQAIYGDAGSTGHAAHGIAVGEVGLAPVVGRSVGLSVRPRMLAIGTISSWGIGQTRSVRPIVMANGTVDNYAGIRQREERMWMGFEDDPDLAEAA